MPIKERKIGNIVGFDQHTILVELDEECNSQFKSLMGATHRVLSVNTLVTIPVLCEKLIGVINKISVEPERIPNDKNLYLIKSKRIVEINLIGKIIECGQNEFRFEQGISIYPCLDQSVCFISNEELKVIYDNPDPLKEVEIGRNTQVDQPIYLDIDKFFGMHAAILGNTGTGKSHTLTAVIRSALKKLESETGENTSPATIIIFDSNGEYKNAFNNIPNISVKYFSNEENEYDNFFIPYWYLNSQEFFDLFQATPKTQQPFLSSVMSLAKLNMAEDCEEEFKDIRYRELAKTFEKVLNVSLTIPDETRYYGRKISICKHLRVLISQLELPIDDQEIVEDYSYRSKSPSEWTYCTEKVRTLLEKFNDDEYDLKGILETSTSEKFFADSIVDLPLFFDWEDLVTDIWNLILVLSDNSKMEEWVSTLKWRIRSILVNKEYKDLLALDLSAGSCTGINLVDYLLHTLFGYANKKKEFQVIIIDTSFVNQKVLSVITSVIGRIILDIQKKIRSKDSTFLNPILLVLEEAHNYIPNKEERNINEESVQMASKQTFEKIAKEGRKYGLGMLVSSQRPSELSKTVLSQCNSFIIHRLQNPLDLDIIKRSIPYLSKDLAEKLNTIQRQVAMVFGQAFRAPTLAKILTLEEKNRPDSKDVEYSKYWTGNIEGFSNEGYADIIADIANSLELKPDKSKIEDPEDYSVFGEDDDLGEIQVEKADESDNSDYEWEF